MEVAAYEVLHWLYGIQRKTKQALGRAESRPGVTREELDNLNKKLACIDYLIVEMWRNYGKESNHNRAACEEVAAGHEGEDQL